MPLRPLTSEHTDQLDTAFCEAQGEFKGIAKDKNGYNFKYMSFENVVETVRPILKKYGLSFRQHESWYGDWDLLITRLHHSSGQWAESCARLRPEKNPKKNLTETQEFGSHMTYRKRYSLNALLGIAAGDPDSDSQ